MSQWLHLLIYSVIDRTIVQVSSISTTVNTDRQTTGGQSCNKETQSCTSLSNDHNETQNPVFSCSGPGCF
jgi:hypothetical protein